ncbi:MAG: signal peptidase I [Desulfobulbaceae bacterium]|jgi:signal peptidase I|nr:signal peptidase I [Desulfobulbaceae bacterium]
MSEDESQPRGKADESAQASANGAGLKAVAVEKEKNWFREIIETLVIVIVLVFVIRAFVVQAFKIPSGSMLPTLQIGDHLLVNRFAYGLRMPETFDIPWISHGDYDPFKIPLPFARQVLLPVGEPKRGDVVVFRYPKDRNIDFIKRVIGLPGDTVEVRDKTLFVNGEKAPDPHAHFTDGPAPDPIRGPRDNFGPMTVPEGHIFVMGDNRDNSYDGRFWGFVPEDDVLGKAFILYWSWDLQQTFTSSERWQSIRWRRIGDLID